MELGSATMQKCVEFGKKISTFWVIAREPFVVEIWKWSNLIPNLILHLNMSFYKRKLAFKLSLGCNIANIYQIWQKKSTYFGLYLQKDWS